MSETVSLPPGCQGFTTMRGEVLKPNSNGTITLEDHDAKSLRSSQHRSIGLVTPMSFNLGTKAGTRCPACHFHGQAWTTECPRCQSEMVSDADSSLEITVVSS